MYNVYHLFDLKSYDLSIELLASLYARAQIVYYLRNLLHSKYIRVIKKYIKLKKNRLISSDKNFMIYKKILNQKAKRKFDSKIQFSSFIKKVP